MSSGSVVDFLFELLIISYSSKKYRILDLFFTAGVDMFGQQCN